MVDDGAAEGSSAQKNLSNLWLIYVYLLVLSDFCEVCDASFYLSLIFRGELGSHLLLRILIKITLPLLIFVTYFYPTTSLF